MALTFASPDLAFCMATKRRSTFDRERCRVLKLLDAHQGNFEELGEWGGHLYIRLRNMIANGVDLDKEMELPIDERVMFFHWPDEEEEGNDCPPAA